MNSVTMVEGSALTTGFLVIIGGIYKFVSNNHFRITSSCSDRVVEHASEIIEKKIEERVNQVMSASAPKIQQEEAQDIENNNNIEI